MRYEISTVPISDADQDTSLSVSSIAHKDIALSWREIWRLICGEKLHLRVIQRWHPIGENSATASLRLSRERRSTPTPPTRSADDRPKPADHRPREAEDRGPHIERDRGFTKF